MPLKERDCWKNYFAYLFT